MISNGNSLRSSPYLLGIREALPLLGGYIPVSLSFGLISIQAGFSVWETVIISTFIYAGASQFLFVGMVAAGAPLWLVVVMTLLINARHVVYGPNLAPWLPPSRRWPWLIHGLTDQVFALALTRFPQIPAGERVGWFTGTVFLSWFSWIGGTALGAIAGAELTAHWPLLGQVLPFALPALFLVLLAPRFGSKQWTIALISTIAIALLLTVNGLNNAAIPVAAAFGCLCFYLVKSNNEASRGKRDE